MRSFAPKELLGPGDIFDLREPTEAGASTFLAKGFDQGCLSVAELDGENRDNRLVAPRDLPLPGEFSKWPLNISVAGRREDYVRDILAALRENVADLRFAMQSGMGMFFDGLSTDKTPFTVYANLEEAFLFRRARYGVGWGQIRPVLDAVDVNKLGIIPEEWIHRREDGKVFSWDARTTDMRVRAEHIPSIDAAASRAGVQVYAGIFDDANVFPQSQRDRALDSMDGYLPGDPRFDTLNEAHEAVQALVAKALR